MADTTASAPDTSTTSPPAGSGSFDEEAWVESRLSGTAPEEVPAPAAEKADEAPATTAQAQEPETPAETAKAPEQAAAPALAPDVVEALAEARLRPVEGETTEQALRRLNKHYAGRTSAHFGELRELKTELTGLKGMVTPLWQALQQQYEAQQREAAMRQVPDKEADPAAYNTWLMEQMLARQEQDRLAAEQAAAEGEQQAALVGEDETALNDLVYGLENDAEVRDGYSFALQVSMQSAKQQYPTATPEQLEEVAKLSQQLMMRGLIRQGASPAGYYRNMYTTARNLLVGQNGQNGNAAPAAQAATQPQAPPAQQPAAQPAPQPTPAPAPQPQGSQTAARLRAESAAAAARAVVSPGPAAGSPPTGEGIDLRQLDDEQAFELYQEFAKANRVDEWERMVQTQFGVARR